MSNLKIAIQKSGRLNEKSLQLLKDCGIGINNGLDQLKANASNFPLELLFLRNSDIPQYLEDGVADIAIIGENVLIEKNKKVDKILNLGFAKCRLALAIKKEEVCEGIEWFANKKIATSYPNTLKKYLTTHNVKAETHFISGSVEIAPNIGLSDAVCDLVSSGSTLFKNGLKEAMTILTSEACLAKNKNLTPEKNAILAKLLFRMNAVLKAKNTKYVMMNVPNGQIDAITNILPVLKSPSIIPLATPGWSSLHTVINESKFWEVIDQLKKAGAEGILVMAIEKMVA